MMPSIIPCFLQVDQILSKTRNVAYWSLRIRLAAIFVLPKSEFIQKEPSATHHDLRFQLIACPFPSCSLWMSVSTNSVLTMTKIDFVREKKIYLTKALVHLTYPQIFGESQRDPDFLRGWERGLWTYPETETADMIAAAWWHAWKSCPLDSYAARAWVVLCSRKSHTEEICTRLEGGVARSDADQGYFDHWQSKWLD